MANFTNDIKNEIILNGMKNNREKRAALSAFFRVSGEISYDFFTHAYGMEFVTESEEAAEFFFDIIEKLYAIPLTTTFKEDRLSGKEKLRFGYKEEKTKEILADLGLLNENDDFVLTVLDDLVSEPQTKIAFIKGAFLGSGSCTVPHEKGGKTGYHLRFSFRSSEIASNFAEILCSLDILAKMIEHKGAFVVYINSKESISDFLSVIGAEESLAVLDSIVEQRDNSNNENRSLNCASGNRARTQKAAAMQYEAIETIIENGQFDKLPHELQEIALLRKDHPDYSLQQIADVIGISKSSANNRIKKLLEIYELLDK